MRVGLIIGLASWATFTLVWSLVMYGSLSMLLSGLVSVALWEALSRVWKSLSSPGTEGPKKDCPNVYCGAECHVTHVPVRLEHAREDSLTWAYSLVVEDLKFNGFYITADMVKDRGPIKSRLDFPADNPTHQDLESACEKALEDFDIQAGGNLLPEEEPITLTYDASEVEAKLGDVQLKGDYVEGGESTLVKGGWDY